jgi:SEC-C motif domain protein
MNAKTKNTPCPCGAGSYSECCGRFINGGKIAPSAVDLMRSRYTAFALRNEDYLRATWWPGTLPEEAIVVEDDVKWISLKIVGHAHASHADEATVEFIAAFKVGGRAHKLHEISNFVRQPDPAGTPRWYYVDGVFPGYE